MPAPFSRKLKALSKSQTTEQPEPQSKPLYQEITSWAGTVLILLFASTFLVQAFVIPTGSMEDNLLVGDHLLVDKLAYAPHGTLAGKLLPYTDIKRGDIIVFRYPVDIKQTYVKRVIGMPGDHIRIEAKQVYLNGKPLREPYKIHKTEYLMPFRDAFPDAPISTLPAEGVEMLTNHVENGEVIVPPGHYFALGDNRDNSEDSRYWGFVPRENIIGKPWIIYWSYDAPTKDLASGDLGLDHMLDVALHFFGKTRWDRTFQLVRGYEHVGLN